MINGKCNLFCPDFGYCANRNKRNECSGFSPMDSDEEEHDVMEEKLERATY